jgi:hypothetical protein
MDRRERVEFRTEWIRIRAAKLLPIPEVRILQLLNPAQLDARKQNRKIQVPSDGN